LFLLKIPLFGRVTEFDRKYLISFRGESDFHQLGWAIFNLRCFTDPVVADQRRLDATLVQAARRLRTRVFAPPSSSKSSASFSSMTPPKCSASTIGTAQRR
jgi:hypothetical protein